jgi:hypothetical protein
LGNTIEWMRSMLEQLHSVSTISPLNELFASFKPSEADEWQYDGKDRGEHQWTFTVDGKNYTTWAYPLQGELKSIFMIEFRLENAPGGFGIASKPGDSSTATKGVARVFELVAYCLSDLLRHETVNGFFFTAKEPSRQKLYNVLASKISQETGWIRRDDIGDWIKTTSEKAFLIVNPVFLKDILQPAFNINDKQIMQPKLTRQPDTFGSLPIRMD